MIILINNVTVPDFNYSTLVLFLQNKKDYKFDVFLVEWYFRLFKHI